MKNAEKNTVKNIIYKIEIIANQSMEEEIVEWLHKRKGLHYSLIQGVRGMGYSGPRLGSEVWPEENIMVIVYCDLADASYLKEKTQNARKRNNQEGVAFFSQAISTQLE